MNPSFKRQKETKLLLDPLILKQPVHFLLIVSAFQLFPSNIRLIIAFNPMLFSELHVHSNYMHTLFSEGLMNKTSRGQN